MTEKKRLSQMSERDTIPSLTGTQYMELVDPSRTCEDCGIPLFKIRRKNKCKACHALYLKDYIKRYREENREDYEYYQKQYYAENKETIKNKFKMGIYVKKRESGRKGKDGKKRR